MKSIACHTPFRACRGLHSCTLVNGKLYLFGGASQQGKMMNDLWVLDLGSKQWTELHPEGNLPHIRCSHTTVAVGSSLVIFGGSYYRQVTMPLCDVNCMHRSCCCTMYYAVSNSCGVQFVLACGMHATTLTFNAFTLCIDDTHRLHDSTLVMQGEW